MVPKGRPKKDERPGKKKEVKKMVAGKKEPPGSKKEKKIPKKIPKFSADYEKTPEFDYEDLMKDPNFNKPDLICSPDPAEFNEDYYRRTGLRKPILFHCDPVELGMTIPDSRNFSVNDVLKLIGGNRLIEVVRVEDQSTIKMSLKQFIKSTIIYRLRSDPTVIMSSRWNIRTPRLKTSSVDRRSSAEFAGPKTTGRMPSKREKSTLNPTANIIRPS
ncbi:unnamed protein product [Caenorhabditis auriculariae]|uniref:Uncharacterized protein n=1 Tax=Caenorhabditis auriculariae TaxID=2777116 RepID=A0A8S1HD91_9PELO|nr:unnamed protein product [Caenorhabditis auriculariae]